MSLSTGNITVSNGYKATYAAHSSVNTLGATNDLIYIIGSSTKTIRINRIAISGQRTTPTLTEVLLVKRSPASTGGSGLNNAIEGPGSYSALNPAFTAIIKTSASVLGTLVGIIRSTKINILGTSYTGAAQNQYVWSFNRPSQELVLRGTNECIAVNFNGVTIIGGVITVWIEWTEE